MFRGTDTGKSVPCGGDGEGALVGGLPTHPTTHLDPPLLRLSDLALPLILGSLLSVLGEVLLGLLLLHWLLLRLLPRLLLLILRLWLRLLLLLFLR